MGSDPFPHNQKTIRTYNMEIKLKFTEVVTDDLKELPFHGTELSAGYDLTAMSDPKIKGDQDADGNWRRIDYIQYNTGIQIAPPAYKTWASVGDPYVHVHHTLLFPRSSVSKYNLQLANSIGLVDSDYRGEVLLRFNYVWQPEDLLWVEANNEQDNGVFNQIRGIVNQERIYKKGDQIGQIVASPTTFIDFKEVDDLDATDRGSGGFGSTTKKQDG
jgi:dUTP pyrophosphatase